MKRNLFREYMDSKKNMKKPVVDISGDQLDVRNNPNTMPKPAKGRYKPGVCEPRTAGNDWGRLGEKNLIYKPDIKGKGSCKPAKIPTAEQIRHSGEIVSLIRQDPSTLEILVREMKKRGLLGALVAEMFGHRETHSHLAEILTSDIYGPTLMQKITDAMNEEVAKPYGDQLEDKGEEEEQNSNDPFADEEDEEDDEDDEDEDGDDDDDEDIGNGDKPGQDADIQVGMEGDPNSDPSMMGMDPSMGGMDPSMGGMQDPSMMGMDPSMGGMDPSMMGGMQDPSMMGMDPSMMGGMPPPMPQQPPMTPMQQFQRKLMRAYQRAMMRKQ